MKVVILNGSPRKGGNTEIMAETFAKTIRKYLDVIEEKSRKN